MIKRTKGMLPGQLKTRVEQLRTEAANRPREEKERLGQFLTPQEVAALVAALFQPLPEETQHIRLLDPGAGVGSLTFAFVHWLTKQGNRPESLEIVAIECDDNLIAPLKDTLKSCKKLASDVGIAVRVNTIHGDFLKLCNDGDGLFSSNGVLNEFSHIIMNPPYRKISGESDERELLRKRGIEVSNIYAGFVALASQLLGSGGELSAITPRSFCNGTYFRDFRQRLFSPLMLQAAHLFVSRQRAFAHDSVLQENIIFAVRKTSDRPSVVSIRTSNGPDSNEVEHLVPYSTVISPKDPEMVIHLPADEAGIQAMEFVAGLPAKLADFDVSVSTGPVVDFRAKEYLSPEPKEGAVPLLYPSHFSPNGIVWPKSGRKPNAILDDPAIASSLVSAGNFVLVKRFSSKEEKKRITARVLESTQFAQHPRIGLENHLNFFHHDGKGLDADLSFGLATYLNSTVVDVYFRQFNGHTQVNAADLRMMRYPDAVKLRLLGRAAQEDRQRSYDQSRTDELVAQVLGLRMVPK